MDTETPAAQPDAILSPGEATFHEIVIPLIAEAHDRVAAVHARHLAGTSSQL
jgi:hypothetical protein